MAKKEEKLLERVYNVPLRKEFMKVPRWRKSKKAVTALKQFLQRHMKSEDVKLSKNVNEYVWKHGIKNPPHHVKVTVTKDKEGEVKAELFGFKEKVKHVTKKDKVKTAEETKKEPAVKESSEKEAAEKEDNKKVAGKKE